MIVKKGKKNARLSDIVKDDATLLVYSIIESHSRNVFIAYYAAMDSDAFNHPAIANSLNLAQDPPIEIFHMSVDKKKYPVYVSRLTLGEADSREMIPGEHMFVGAYTGMTSAIDHIFYGIRDHFTDHLAAQEMILQRILKPSHRGWRSNRIPVEDFVQY